MGVGYRQEWWGTGGEGDEYKIQNTFQNQIKRGTKII